MAEYEEHKLYGGLVLVRYYPEIHRYYASVKGGPFKQRTGVTTLIGIKDKSRALKIWGQEVTAGFLFKLIEMKKPLTQELAVLAAIQNDILADDAASVGKEAHGWCEAFIKNKLRLPGFEKMPDMPARKEAVAGVNSFLEWWDANKVEPITSEQIVYSMKHDYIGTMDFDAQINGIRGVIDFKTSNGLYNGVRLQTTGYKIAREEELGKKVYRRRWAIRLSKYTETEHYEKEGLKRELKQLVAQLRGQKPSGYQEKPYQVFEAMCLEDTSSVAAYNKNMAMDDKAFMDAVRLYRWDRATDFFLNS